MMTDNFLLGHFDLCDACGQRTNRLAPTVGRRRVEFDRLLAAAALSDILRV